MNEIYTFNTGRQYSAANQRMAFTVIRSEPSKDLEDVNFLTVAFVDFDRMIEGVVEVGTTQEVPSVSAIMCEYDRGGYGYIRDRQLAETLVKAAMNADKRNTFGRVTEVNLEELK